MKSRAVCPAIAATVFIPLLVAVGHAAEAVAGTPNANDGVWGALPLYGVHELVFNGPACGPADSPARDVELVTQWRHESGRPVYTIQGFWDGDGRGGVSGPVFKVRFCPSQAGKWTLVEVASNKAELRGQHEGYVVTCTASDQPGFWVVDHEQTGGRWYKRSNGAHPYIYGNTMYSFLSEYDDKGPNGSNIADDIRANAAHFKKVRFSITGDRYPHPQVKPFLDDSGQPTDNGNFSHGPNPAWFHQRVDVAVRTAAERDLIADLILCGPDTQDSRSVLQASGNGGDPTPLLRYIAARYGSYPNVWLCLCNEFDIKQPRYTCEQIARFGGVLRQFLPYPTPLSVHASTRDWHVELNTAPAWNDHVIIQRKIKKLPEAADWVARNHVLGGHIPVIDDELAYEGAGDGWSEADVIEAHLGAFLGGGYGTTGCKPANKKGHYFWGNFKASEHLAADNLGWLREVIDENITFWRMTPVEDANSGNGGLGIFRRVPLGSRAMAWPGQEYVLGTNRGYGSVQIDLPAGRWHVAVYDALRMQKTILSEDASGRFSFEIPDSRAVLFHFRKRND
jgi:hypothetical protein